MDKDTMAKTRASVIRYWLSTALNSKACFPEARGWSLFCQIQPSREQRAGLAQRTWDPRGHWGEEMKGVISALLHGYQGPDKPLEFCGHQPECKLRKELVDCWSDLSGSPYWFSPSLEQTSVTNIKCFNKSKGKIYWMWVVFIRGARGNKTCWPTSKGPRHGSQPSDCQRDGKVNKRKSNETAPGSVLIRSVRK